MMQALPTAVLVVLVSLGFSQTRAVSRPSVVAAFPMRWLISASRDRLSLIVVGELVYNAEFVVVDGVDRWRFHTLG